MLRPTSYSGARPPGVSLIPPSSYYGFVYPKYAHHQPPCSHTSLHPPGASLFLLSTVAGARPAPSAAARVPPRCPRWSPCSEAARSITGRRVSSVVKGGWPVSDHRETPGAPTGCGGLASSKRTQSGFFPRTRPWIHAFEVSRGGGPPMALKNSLDIP